MSSPKRILVAGVGNIFLGDDAFGSEVARRLVQRALPAEVQVRDYGTCSYDLAYAMMEGYEATEARLSDLPNPIVSPTVTIISNQLTTPT